MQAHHAKLLQSSAALLVYIAHHCGNGSEYLEKGFLNPLTARVTDIIYFRPMRAVLRFDQVAFKQSLVR